MLRGLEIRDLLIIDRLDIAFQPGLNVLTGETGAGKSILLDALGFVLGWRGRAELVRAGADQGEVTAWFDLAPDHPARDLLAEAGLPVEDELLLRRVNTADGRKTAYVNDRRASGEVLRALSDVLVELHGQQDDRGLLNPRGHRRLLDAFADHGDALSRVRDAWRGRAKAAEALERARADLDKARADEDFLRHAISELDTLDPQPGEDAQLDADRRLMQGAERLRIGISKAHQALGPEGAEGPMLDAQRWLEEAAADVGGRLDEPLAALARALNDLGEAEQGVAACLDALDVDPGALESAEERLFAIRALARKHGLQPDALTAFAQDLRARVDALDLGAGTLDTLSKELGAANAAYEAAAADLSARRSEAATRLDAAMAAELAPLKLNRAVFTTLLEPAEPGPEGTDAVTFTVSTNPGAPAGALNKIASGGELSRFLLALKVCLTAGNAGLTLIFDEIDRGVGGATADAVGRRLAALAEGAQVLVVTHSPQVAARAGHHWQVTKSVAGEVATSNVVPLDPGARVDEIARMLAGDTISDEARAAARALLAG